mgnify:CR=1 FL=1
MKSFSFILIALSRTDLCFVFRVFFIYRSKVVSTMASSVVPKWEYEAKVQECMDKDETIHVRLS